MGCFYQLLQVETGNVLTVLMDMQSKARHDMTYQTGGAQCCQTLK